MTNLEDVLKNLDEFKFFHHVLIEEIKISSDYWLDDREGTKAKYLCKYFDAKSYYEDMEVWKDDTEEVEPDPEHYIENIRMWIVKEE